MKTLELKDMQKIRNILITLLCITTVISCGAQKNKKETKEEENKEVLIPTFNADSAYAYIEKQVSFGPRVPNSAGHKACASYLKSKLEEVGAKVTTQEIEVTAYDGTLLNATNIIGSYQPDKKKRVALFTHWDTRPWADNDPDSKHHYTPVIGANDGASGVGVLLEIGRQLSQNEPELGVDLILFDAEDYGPHQEYRGEHNEAYWCLGSQHWAKHPHVANYNARFGILLDMVGGENATFFKEYYSEHYAKEINSKVWKRAHKLGYSAFFIKKVANWPVIDDHLFVNKLARIPTIDIIPHHPNNPQSSFGDTWHTVDDTLENINRETLKAVGQTVLAIIYNEK